MNLKLLLPLLACMISACSSTKLHDINTESIHIHKNSIGSDRAALAHDMASSVDQFIKRKLNCSTWSLEDVIASKAEGQMVFTSDGQIYRGKASETWVVQLCGKTLTLGLVITPASPSGSIIKIRKL